MWTDRQLQGLQESKWRTPSSSLSRPCSSFRSPSFCPFQNHVFTPLPSKVSEPEKKNAGTPFLPPHRPFDGLEAPEFVSEQRRCADELSLSLLLFQENSEWVGGKGRSPGSQGTTVAKRTSPALPPTWEDPRREGILPLPERLEHLQNGQRKTKVRAQLVLA